MYQAQFSTVALDLDKAAFVSLLRAWRGARDQGLATMPAMAKLAPGQDGAILAPVIDSLAHLFELALGRPLCIGRDEMLSPDEHLLLDAIDRQGCRSDWAGEGVSGTLIGAIRSARVMLALATRREAPRAKLRS